MKLTKQGYYNTVRNKFVNTDYELLEMNTSSPFLVNGPEGEPVRFYAQKINLLNWEVFNAITSVRYVDAPTSADGIEFFAPEMEWHFGFPMTDLPTWGKESSFLWSKTLGFPVNKNISAALQELSKKYIDAVKDKEKLSHIGTCLIKVHYFTVFDGGVPVMVSVYESREQDNVCHQFRLSASNKSLQPYLDYMVQVGQWFSEFDTQPLDSIMWFVPENLGDLKTDRDYTVFNGFSTSEHTILLV